MPLFGKLARDGPLGGPVLINAGRGGLQVEADIVAALDEGVLGGASLDVFETEPLDGGEPAVGHRQRGDHAARAACETARRSVPAMLAQIDAFEAGAPLTNLVDRKAGY